MIAKGQVMIALQPWLGARLSGWLEPVMDEITRRLNLYSSRQAPEALCQEMDSMLFQAIRHFTRGTMLAQLPDGTWVRIQMEDIAMMADDLMGLVFQQFPVDSAHLIILREYSLRCASLSALKALYTRYAALHSQEELRAIESVARACHPPFRWQGWLNTQQT